MTAIDAFHMRQQIHEDLHTRNFATFAHHFASSLRGEVAETIGVDDFGAGVADRLPFIASGDALIAREVRVLRMSEAFYVAPLMQSMVTAAAESWPADEPVEAEGWPTSHGFMYVPGGVSTVDVRGQVNTTVAFTWEVHAEGTTVVWWTDKMTDNPLTKEEPYWQNMARWTPWHVTWLEHGKPLPTGLVLGTVLPPEVSAAMQWVKGPNGSMSLAIPHEGWTAAELKPHVGVDRVSAWLVAALRIMQQPLAAVERKGMPANVRRALDRRPRTLRQKAVTVIDFRRRESDFEAHGTREYSHRFLRRGHWRRQPYKRDDGTWDRRRIWIHATIVGDPDKPLILRNHVNALMR
jgi:hypothetical protein